MELQEIKFSKFTNLLPFFGAFIILVGVIKLQLFYSFFGISIYEYLETGEILLAFLKDFILFAALLYFCFFIAYFLKIISYKWNSKNIKKEEISENVKTGEEKNENETKNKKRNFYFLIIINVIFILFIVFILYYFIILYGVRKIHIIFMYLVIMILIICCLFLIRFVRQFLNGKNIGKSMNIITLIVLTASYMAFIACKINIDVDIIKQQKSYFGTFITTTDSTYVSDSTFYYIGKTNNFVFLYNEKTLKYTALPMSEVKKMEISTK